MRIGYELQDKFAGTNTLGKFHYLMSSQWFDENEIYELQFSKFKSLIEHVGESVPYYREYFKTHKLTTNQFKELSDIELLPVIDKNVITNNPRIFISDKFDTSSRLVQKGKTGGTTGKPLKLYKDRNDRSWIWGAFYRFYDWMDIDLSDNKTILWGQPIISKSKIKSLIFQIKDKLQSTQKINTFKINKNKLTEIVNKIQSHNPKLIHGYVNAIYSFALLLEEQNEIQTITPRSVSTTAEPLFQYQRDKIKEVFGTETFDQYGCGEVNSIAFECNAHTGLHIVSERVYMEILDKEGNHINSNGDIVISNFDNYVMPILRYKNGDQAKLIQNNCACGRNLQKMSHVSGRSGDMIVSVEGTKDLHPEFFTHLLNELNIYDKYSVEKYQVIQKTRSHIEWLFVIEPNIDQDDRSKIKKYIRAYLGDISVNIIEVDRIEVEGSGKFRYVKSLVDR